MSQTGKFSTHHVPDDGTWYTPGETVRIDQSLNRVQIVKDPHGDYEVHSCRKATEYTRGPALLRVGLRKIPVAERTDPPLSVRPSSF